jgi:HD-GYP domain-containing protein (c-di-GMP phosphodiesterase class II)
MNTVVFHCSHRQSDSGHNLGYRKPLRDPPRGTGGFLPGSLSGSHSRPPDIDLMRINDASIDDAIEGWVRALSRRDQETEEHTRRVADMTLKLARAMHVDPADFTQIRRGALLHDIGKMAIPDAILLKPGPLSDEEWDVMRCHPVYAYDWLVRIRALRPALDIPYCHHERWDGTGYPRGLKGEQIPLAARIFAVVDIWDALRSDRPYRRAWPEEEVGHHILALAGTHLDPEVVEAFLRTMPDDGVLSDRICQVEVGCGSPEPCVPAARQNAGKFRRQMS